MRFIEKIRELTEDARSIEYTCPRIAQAIKKCAANGSNHCEINLIPEEIEALRAEGFQVSEAPFLFEHYIEW